MRPGNIASPLRMKGMQANMQHMIRIEESSETIKAVQ